MRLLNIYSLQLEEFSSNPPRYAILSHRWAKNETSYKDFAKGRNKQSACHAKIEQFCDWVKQSFGRHRKTRPRGWVYLDDVEWVWVDTCCIDKRSSAELSEAINSMWKWYERAEYCLAYLADVEPRKVGACTDVESTHLSDSSWFNRGWTLQELLAPREVIFCNKDWQEIGYRSKLAGLVSARTGIPSEYLQSRYSEEGSKQEDGISFLQTACVAQKLSWAGTRETTREEDSAYCLLGLLGINMPLLYGEGGSRAFRRLQEEFVRKFDDESLFAVAGRHAAAGVNFGILGSGPQRFVGCENVRIIKAGEPDFVARSPFMITNKGLQFHAPAIRAQYTDLWHDDELELRKYDTRNIYVVPLNCRDVSPQPLSEYLPKNPFMRRNGQCVVLLAEDNEGLVCRARFYFTTEKIEQYWARGQHVKREFLIKLTH